MMRRVGASVALLCSTVAPASAQSFGVTAGMTSSDVFNAYGDGSGTSYADRGAVTIGATYRRRLAPGIGLQPELLLVQRGWGEPSRPTLSLAYLEMPLLLRVGAIAPGSGARVRPVLTLGTGLNLLLACDLSGIGVTQAEGTGCRRRIVRPFVEDYRVPRVDVGAIAGLGVEGRTSGGTIVGVDGRLEYGLTDIRPGIGGTSHNVTFFVLVNVVPRVGARR